MRRIHQLDHELNEAKRMYAERIAHSVDEYRKSAEIGLQLKTKSSNKDVVTTQNLDIKSRSSIGQPHDYSHQPNMLNALRNANSYNEAFSEVVDPVGAIVPDQLMNIERPPYKKTGDRRRFQRVFTLRTPRKGIFPR